MNKYQKSLNRLANIDLQTYPHIIGNDNFRPEDIGEPAYVCDCYNKDFENLQELIDKQEKCKWHDLRKDPNNLPKNEVVNICYDTKLGYAYSSAIHNGIKWILGEVDEYLGANNEVIGWKYIKRFEDE